MDYFDDFISVQKFELTKEIEGKIIKIVTVKPSGSILYFSQAIFLKNETYNGRMVHLEDIISLESGSKKNEVEDKVIEKLLEQEFVWSSC